jgi:hypothetical protein
MKNVLASLFLLCLLSQNAFSQDGSIRGQAVGVSFILNDFTTPQAIRNGSLEKTFREKTWSKFGDMSPGLALTYFKGLKKHVDFAGTLGASIVSYPLRNGRSTPTNGLLLLEADASVNLNMLTDAYWVTPYLSAGVGASAYKGYYGAIIPLGLGFKINLFDEVNLFISSQYRVPVTYETANYHFTYSFGVAPIIGK